MRNWDASTIDKSEIRSASSAGCGGEICNTIRYAARVFYTLVFLIREIEAGSTYIASVAFRIIADAIFNSYRALSTSFDIGEIIVRSTRPTTKSI